MPIQQPPIYTGPSHNPWPPQAIENWARRHSCSENNVCVICLVEIKVQIYKNSGVCCEQHRKDRDNDHEPFKAVGLRIHEGEAV